MFNPHPTDAAPVSLETNPIYFEWAFVLGCWSLIVASAISRANVTADSFFCACVVEWRSAAASEVLSVSVQSLQQGIESNGKIKCHFQRK